MLTPLSTFNFANYITNKTCCKDFVVFCTAYKAKKTRLVALFLYCIYKNNTQTM